MLDLVIFWQIYWREIEWVLLVICALSEITLVLLNRGQEDNDAVVLLVSTDGPR